MDYTLEKDIEIISDYQEGEDLINTGVDNEFIIVDKEFLESMNIRDFDEKKVGILKDELNRIKVKFLSSHYELFIEKNENGFYKFIKSNVE